MKNKKYFLFSNHQLLLEKNDTQFLLPCIDALVCDIQNASTYFIGDYHGSACYAAEIPNLSSDEKYELYALKSALTKLHVQWHSAAARAYQIIQWDHNHQYCGRCGQKTRKIPERFEKRCDACHLYFFPKISPAVIVLIKKGDQILMARQKQFPEGVYALIAGFVEAGETLEETVHREVYEEVGISVKNIRYWGSQSWPFPDSLMLAFTAEYAGGEIECRDGELEMAGWYDVDNLPGYPSSTTSIAMKMIEDFIQSRK